MVPGHSRSTFLQTARVIPRGGRRSVPGPAGGHPDAAAQDPGAEAQPAPHAEPRVQHRRPEEADRVAAEPADEGKDPGVYPNFFRFDEFFG